MRQFCRLLLAPLFLACTSSAFALGSDADFVGEIRAAVAALAQQPSAPRAVPAPITLQCSVSVRRAYSTLAAAQAGVHFSGKTENSNLGVYSDESLSGSLVMDADSYAAQFGVANYTGDKSFLLDDPASKGGQFIFAQAEYYDGPDGRVAQLYAELVRVKADGTREVLAINRLREPGKTLAPGVELSLTLSGVEWRTAIYNHDKSRPINISDLIANGALTDASVLSATLACRVP